MPVVGIDWLSHYGVGLTPAHLYLAAVYWSTTTLTTVGYGDLIPTTDAERVYAAVAMCIGGIFYGYVVGNISSMVANSDLNKNAFYQGMDLIQAWLDHHTQIPASVRRQIRQYFKNYLMEKSAKNEADIVDELPPHALKEVAEYVLDDNIRHNPLFDGLSFSAVVRLQKIVQMVTAEVGKEISTTGEAGTAMFIIEEGSVRLQRATETVRDLVLGHGDSFGEEILSGLAERCDYTAIALEPLVMYMICEDAFTDLFRSMPDATKQVLRNASDIRRTRRWLILGDERALACADRHCTR